MKNSNNKYYEVIKMKLDGIKANFLGDSITEGCGTTDMVNNPFHALIGKKYGMTARNYGIGGTRIAKQRTPSVANPRWDLDFCQRVEEMDKEGVRYSLLGTGNPIAAKLYASCGYSYLPVSGVMMRLLEGGVVDFNRKLYTNPSGKVTVSEGGADMRIPLIPLALLREDHEILDANIELVSPGVFAQSYCMSLYPRYIDLKKRGGKYFAARDEAGLLGGVASIIADENGRMRADYFTAKGFRETAPELVAAVTKEHPEAYFEVGEGDGAKITLLTSLGYTEGEHRLYRHRGMFIPTVIFEKK